MTLKRINSAWKVCLLLLSMMVTANAWSSSEDSLFISLVRACGEYEATHFSDLRLTPACEVDFEMQARKMGYSKSEAREIVTLFSKEKLTALVDTFLLTVYGEATTVEDLNWTIAYFESEKGREVMKHFEYWKGDEFNKRVTQRMIPSMTNLLLEKRVEKEVSTAPKDFQKQFEKYFYSYGGISGVGEIVIERLVAQSDKELTPLILKYIETNLLSLLCDVSYPQLSTDDFKFMNDYFGSSVGKRVTKGNARLFYLVEFFLEMARGQYDEYLQDYYQNTPPSIFQVAPLESDVKEGGNG